MMKQIAEMCACLAAVVGVRGHLLALAREPRPARGAAAALREGGDATSPSKLRPG